MEAFDWKLTLDAIHIHHRDGHANRNARRNPNEAAEQGSTNDSSYRRGDSKDDR